MSNPSKICLGAIVGVHGIKGEVKVKSFTERDRDIDKYSPLEDENGQSLTIKVVGHSKELLRVKIEGVNDRNLAMTFIGKQLFTDRKSLPPLTKDEEYYQTDLVGLAVRELSSGNVAGKVEGVYNFGAGDILEIKVKSSGKLEMIPFNREYVPTVNIEDGYIIVNAVSMQFAPDDEDEKSHES
ncbi:MAG: 16S rRNA processing protein RimM [Alphaproteobacteria bacterium]|nr:16S rRNA processing protein RimM [Alphaproteobacteria bacterium]